MKSAAFRNLLAVLALAGGLFAQSSNAVHADSQLQIAITVDDLPAHGPLPPGVSRLEVAKKILAALKDANIPPVYGFVNAADLEQHPDDEQVLKAWRESGNLLGDHTWSHINLNQHSIEEFEADIKRNQPELGTLMPNADWRWFRFPFLAEGDTPDKRAAIRAFLHQQGYKVAAVSMSFADYAWNEHYVRCKAKGDAKAVDELERGVLQAEEDSITYSREMAKVLYGRDIPYVLLMHIGALDAEMMPKVLELYKSKGVEFITLPQAETNDFYKADTDLSLPSTADRLEELMAERHLSLPPRKPVTMDFDAMCR